MMRIVAAWMYRLEKEEFGRKEIEEIIETNNGSLSRLLSIDGHSLDARGWKRPAKLATIAAFENRSTFGSTNSHRGCYRIKSKQPLAGESPPARVDKKSEKNNNGPPRPVRI
jgi:hypothetical protein